MHDGIANYQFPLKSVARKTFLAFPAHAHYAIWRIWQEVHGSHAWTLFFTDIFIYPGLLTLSVPVHGPEFCHCCACRRLNYNQGRLTPWGRDEMVSHFADDIFRCSFFSMKLVAFRLIFHCSLFQIYNIQALVRIMACRRPGDKPLSEPLVV